jgi:O-antigen ligase
MNRLLPAALFGFLLLIPAVMYAAGSLTGIYFLGAFILALYVCLLVANFEAGVLTLIFVRSSLDYMKQVAGPTGAFNVAAAVSVLLIVLGVFYIVYRRVPILRYRDTGPWLLFLAISGVSIFYSADRLLSTADWLRLVSVFFVYVLTRALFRGEAKLRRVLFVIFLSALVPVLVAYTQLFTGMASVLNMKSGRLLGTFFHPNAFASYLLVMLVFATALALERESLVSRRFLGFMIALIFLIFVLTFSRGAWVVFLFAMLFMGTFRYRRILGLLPVALVVVAFSMPAVIDRLYDAFDPTYQRGRDAWTWRLEAWSDILPLVREKPFFGHGLSQIESEMGYLAHNDYLRLMVEVGLVGFLAYLVLMWTLLGRTLRDYRLAASNVAKSFQFGLLAMTLGFLIREFADNTIRNTVVMMYFWIFVGVCRNMAELEAPASPAPEEGPR